MKTVLYNLIAILTSCLASCTLLLTSGSQDNSNWNSYSSSHFRYFVKPNSLAEQEIDTIISAAEEGFIYVTTILQVTYVSKINVYFYNTILKGGSNEFLGLGFSEMESLSAMYCEYGSGILRIFGPGRITRDTVRHFHEATHVIVDGLYPFQNSGMLSEGIAIALDNCHPVDYEPIDSVAKVAYSEMNEEEKSRNTIQNILANSFRGLNGDIARVFSGSFTRYLLFTHGIDKWKTLYRQLNEDNYETAFVQIYGKSIPVLEKEWLNFLGIQ